MTVARIRPSLEALDELDTFDALCGLITTEDRPFMGGLGFADWRLGGAVARAASSGFFLGDFGERLLIPTCGKLPFPMVFAIGLGPRRQLDGVGFDEVATESVEMLRRAGVRSAAFSISTLPARIAADADESVELALSHASFGRWVWFYGEDEDH